MTKKSKESFKDHALKWREAATQVNPPLSDSESVSLFIQTCKGIYFDKLCASIGKSFADVMIQGELIEDGIKIGCLIDPYTKNEEASLSNKRPSVKKTRKKR
ncbi:hypothetical protein CsSME_00016965 [Camellia sinensis var. sinensis]